jgi:hypothetical protein
MNVPGRRQWRGVARPRARQVDSDGLREVAIAQRMPTVAGFCPAFRGMMPDRTLTTVKHFLHWPSQALSWTRSHADLCWYPLRPIRTHCRCFLWLETTWG